MIIIYGDPMGKQRPKFSSRGSFIKTYTPKETVNYESKVVNAYKTQCGKMFGLECMLSAKIIAYYKIPSSRYRFYKKTKSVELDRTGQLMYVNEIRPTVKPDCDNIAKICLDALNGIAYYDDKQIVELSVKKYYSKEPRVEIEIEEL